MSVDPLARPPFRSNGDHTLGYTETLMYGHYTNLRHYARKEGARLRARAVSRDKSEQNKEDGRDTEHFWITLKSFRHIFFGRTAQDWTFLTLLGFMVALFSFGMDLFIDRCLTAQRWVYKQAHPFIVTQYIGWITFPVVLICFSTGFTHLVGPTAIGSGIPEVKTIMKGVVLKEYLTCKTLIAKVVGLSMSLGSGMPLGKVGPFVHVASVSAVVLSKFFTSFRNELENESLNIDILTAASAVGVSCTFAAPIGGVLFSIEATATYFAVKNYWRGFYSAICGAVMFRLLAMWFKDEETLTAVFRTSLRHDTPYNAVEIISFVAVGVLCGLFGALFVFTHKNIVMLIRRQKKLSAFLQRNRFIYPTIITLVVSSCVFPAGFGKYMAGSLTSKEAVNQMFDNRTWSTEVPIDMDDERMLEVWRGPLNNVFLTIFLFFIMKFWMCAISATLPVPCGIFIPAFMLGASVGRLFGEVMAFCLPQGIGGHLVIPGGYAIVGAATFSGAVTHTVSTAVIVFELTGQIGHILPCVIAVMVAGAIANFLQPSVYDAMIKIKKLPFLPATINPDLCNAHMVMAEDFVVREILYLTVNSSYLDASQLLLQRRFRSYPIVNNKADMTLLGSIHRLELERIVREQISYEKRLENFNLKTITTSYCEKTPMLGIPQHLVHEIEVRRDSPSSLHGYSITKVWEDGLQWDSQSKSLDHSNSRTQDFDWEYNQLNKVINFQECQIDPAPFQIVEKTSLYKVHSLFTLLSLHHAFITSYGRLVGIISLTEVRQVIQKEINMFLPQQPKQVQVSAID